MNDFDRDRLGKSRWWNSPTENLTQTRYARFVRRPWGETRSSFTDSASEWDKTNKLIVGRMEVGHA